MTLVECATLMSITPSRTPFSGGGAKGIRTPDLLVANETRYRLRHSPADRSGRSARRLYHWLDPDPLAQDGHPDHFAAVTPTSLPLHVQRSESRGSQVIHRQGSALRRSRNYADAALRASSPSASGTVSAVVSGASAVTGTWGRAEAGTPAPDRSMVRTVRGASGLDT
jgi:hypothetical protein